MNSESPALKRSLTLPLPTLHGLGNIPGTAIYVLIMALWLPAETLARVTSLLLVVVFTLINLRCGEYSASRN